MPQPLYIFDMDDTLVNGDCAMLWNAFMVEKGIVKDPDFLRKDREMMTLYAKGEMDMEDYLDYTLLPITHIPIQTIDCLVDEFIIQKILPRIFPEALTLIRTLKANDKALLVISATVSFIVQKVAQQIGINQAIGIDLKTHQSFYSTEVAGIPSYREGKIIRLKNWLTNHPTDFDEIHFYTDSINDLPLCLYADHTYLINPCDNLRNEANKHTDWVIYHWGENAPASQ